MEKKIRNRSRPKSQRTEEGSIGDIPASGILLDALFDEVKQHGNSERARLLVRQLSRFAAAGDLLALAMIDRAAAPC